MTLQLLYIDFYTASHLISVYNKYCMENMYIIKTVLENEVYVIIAKNNKTIVKH